MKLTKKCGIINVRAGNNIDEAKKPLRLEKSEIKVSIINIAEQEFNISDNNRAGANPYEKMILNQLMKIKDTNNYLFQENNFIHILRCFAHR